MLSTVEEGPELMEKDEEGSRSESDDKRCKRESDAEVPKTKGMVSKRAVNPKRGGYLIRRLR